METEKFRERLAEQKEKQAHEERDTRKKRVNPRSMFYCSCKPEFCSSFSHFSSAAPTLYTTTLFGFCCCVALAPPSPVHLTKPCNVETLVSAGYALTVGRLRRLGAELSVGGRRLTTSGPCLPTRPPCRRQPQHPMILCGPAALRSSGRHQCR